MNAPEPSTPKQPNWGPLAAIFVSIGIYVVAQVILVFVLIFGPALLGISEQSISELETKNTVAYQFITVATLEAVTIFLLWQFLKSRGARFAHLGLVKLKLQDIGHALAGYAVYSGFFVTLSIALENALPNLNMDQKQDIGYSTATAGPELVFIFIGLVILPPLVEEILFRGFLYTGLRKRLTFVSAGIITSLIFGLAHLLGGEEGSVIWIATIDTFLLSLVLVYLREKYQSLWPPIFVHMFKNCTAFLVLFIFKVV